MGTGFASLLQSEAYRADWLPPEGTYVLFVSTIEARKNHALLFRVWRRMLDEMPPAEVPTLVFAGRVGWLVEDLMKQLDNTGFLNRKISIVQDVTDADLTNLYRGCLFTLFPSLYEGWGLPVTESLALGKPCIAARNTSIPEAGGSLVRYFDPDCVSDAYAVIRATIEDRKGLRDWQAEITQSFVPVPWAATANAILDAIEGNVEPSAPRPVAGSVTYGRSPLPPRHG
jgi:glycosyltransferase involved in cell wall biosynthesis